jgi:hypothetical protein
MIPGRSTKLHDHRSQNDYYRKPRLFILIVIPPPLTETLILVQPWFGCPARLYKTQGRYTGQKHNGMDTCGRRNFARILQV